MVDFILNQIPWWVYLGLGIAAVGALLFFFGPILLPIWRLIPLPARVALAGAFAAFLAWVAGRNKGTEDAKELQRRNDANAVQHRNEVNQSVRDAPAADVDKRLDKWMRD